MFPKAAKQIWILHCLAFSLDPDGASMFHVRNGDRFLEVFMEFVNEEPYFKAPLSSVILPLTVTNPHFPSPLSISTMGMNMDHGVNMDVLHHCLLRNENHRHEGFAFARFLIYLCDLFINVDVLSLSFGFA
ncbi:hypothetical protein L6452_37189 [Arctium lappa]|uniref:Uncharacterized protein n=1 Tax=Arctium lappa TaxID=4217 RepID=A0ACB8Y2U0_ARCLA|nr:hypothetical protein L6452_37189 [Arctium lappa]